MAETIQHLECVRDALNIVCQLLTIGLLCLKIRNEWRKTKPGD